MLRAVRLVCCIVVLMLVSAAGCDDDRRRPRSNSTPTANTSSAGATPTATDGTTAPTPTATSTSALPTRLSGIATRTGFAITHNGQPIDTAGLRALGWTINAALGTGQWSDPALGSMSVSWEIPDARAINGFDASFWGDVTGQNLAMNPTMSTSVFTGGPVEATAYSTGGRKAETPTKRLVVVVPEQPPGTAAQVHMNLGWPQPVLITYNYVYE